MRRKLPIVMIGGVTFYADGAREELWRKSDPSVRIPFTAFFPSGAGFSCLYNKRKQCLAKNMKSVYSGIKSHYLVTLPALAALDPEGITLRYGIPMEALCPDAKPRPPQKVVAEMIPVVALMKVLAIYDL